MAIQNLQARIDKLYELTFGQIEQKKGMKKPKSQATRRLRRTLGGNPIICTVKASQVAKTLKDQFIAKGIDIPHGTNVGTLEQFGAALVEGFRADRRYSQKKGETYTYKAGTAEGTTRIIDYKANKLIEFEIDGFARNDASFARSNTTISQKLMDTPKFAPLFQGGESRQFMEMAHEKHYGIVETKHRLIKGEAASSGGTYSQEMASAKGVELSDLPPDPISGKLKKIQDFHSNLILAAEHEIYVNENGKVEGTTKFRGAIEAKHKNQMDAVAQARLGQDLKDMLTELQETIEEEYKKAEARGATEEKNSRPIADIVGDLIVMSPTKRKAYASGRAINKSKYNVKPKGKSPTKASKRGKVVKRRQALIGGGPTQQNTAPRISMERGTGRGAEDFAVEMRELLKVKNAINKRLPAAVRANMVRPGLVNKSGRFSDSVQVESILPAAQTLMVIYNYRLNPYETFENKGRYRWPTGYNPKPLISKSIRELAMGLVGQKLTIRRA